MTDKPILLSLFAYWWQVVCVCVCVCVNLNETVNDGNAEESKGEMLRQVRFSSFRGLCVCVCVYVCEPK